jgi:hypothetical protein
MDSVETHYRIKELRKENHGFLTAEGLKELAQLNRIMQVLVRCGSGRFVCAAQDAAHFIEIIGTEGTDYVRDVCFVG